MGVFAEFRKILQSQFPIHSDISGQTARAANWSDSRQICGSSPPFLGCSGFRSILLSVTKWSSNSDADTWAQSPRIRFSSSPNPRFPAPNFRVGNPTAIRLVILHWIWRNQRSAELSAPPRRINSENVLPNVPIPHEISKQPNPRK